MEKETGKNDRKKHSLFRETVESDLEKRDDPTCRPRKGL